MKKSRFGQYVLAAFLGVVPGCLGAFAVVSLYSHRMVSFGALVAAMMATSGDEAFVMLSMFPAEALWLSAILFILAIVVAYGADLLFKDQNRFLVNAKHGFELHEEEYCRCFSGKEIIEQLKNITFPRGFLITLFGVFLAAVIFGGVGPEAWNWKKITFTLGAVVSLFIITTVPDHFLEEHLYAHVIKKHLLRVFLWTFGALLVVHYLENHLDVTAWLQENVLSVLVSAAVVGIIPESGPHMVFVTMYAKGLIPFAVLLASSISQDGHGTLPLLAVSTRAFIWLKVVNIVVALLVGMLFLMFM
ncbi:MAG: putative manganese transporter [Campylobacterota bacterium]|nr:putative manganese transporter [Campylobacterota bacterium]